MKKKELILILLCLMLLPLVSGKYWEVTASTSTNKIFYCYNNQSGQREGSAATFNCTDSAFNTDVATIAATNRATGEFNVTVSLAADSYTCEVDCGTASSIDYVIDVFARTTPLVVGDNIGVNWGDVSNQGTSVDLSATTTFVVDTATALTTNNDKTGYALTTQDWTTDSDITTQNNLLETAIDGNQSETETRGDSAWITATGFSTTAESNQLQQALDGNFTQALCFASDLDQNMTDVFAEFTTVTSNQDTIDTNVKEINVTTQNMSDVILTVQEGRTSNWSNIGGGSGLTVGGIADAVWNELLSDHVASGSAGLNLTDKGTATISTADKVEIIQGTTANVSTNLSADHQTGDWTGGGAGITDAQIKNIVQGTYLNTTGKNINATCLSNGTSAINALEGQLNCLYTGWY